MAVHKRYTYEEVKKILCEACKAGLPFRKGVSRTRTYIVHVCNKEVIDCTAETWIRSEGGSEWDEQREPKDQEEDAGDAD